MGSVVNTVTFQLENIAKKFGGLMAISEFKLGIKQGQIMGLIGTS